MSWITQNRTGSTLNYNKPTADIDLSASLMQLAGIGFEKRMSDASFAYKFYKKWADISCKNLAKFAKENKGATYRVGDATYTVPDSKKIPLRSKYKVSGKYAILYVWSYPTNYVFHVGTSNVPSKWIKFKKNEPRKPVHGAKGWFTPKRYKRDIPKADIKKRLVDIDEAVNDTPKRFFTSKTSHGGTRNYKMPFVWYESDSGKVKPLNLRVQLADMVLQSTELNNILKGSFIEAIDKVGK